MDAVAALPREPEETGCFLGEPTDWDSIRDKGTEPGPGRPDVANVEGRPMLGIVDCASNVEFFSPRIARGGWGLVCQREKKATGLWPEVPRSVITVVVVDID